MQSLYTRYYIPYLVIQLSGAHADLVCAKSKVTVKVLIVITRTA